MKITISVEGTNKESNKRLIQIMDDLLFKNGTPEGVDVEFRNIRTRTRKPKSTAETLPSNEVVEETAAQENQ